MKAIANILDWKQMKIRPEIIQEILAFLCAFLFFYTGVNKLIIFQEFNVQLSKVSILTDISEFVAIVIPLIEITLAVLIVVPRTRLFGLYGFFGMMVMFTAYIVFAIKFSDVKICSCGGVLERLGWTEHLIFNLGFIGLAMAVITSWRKKINLKSSTTLIALLVTIALGSLGLVAGLAVYAESKNGKSNGFTRILGFYQAEKQTVLKLPDDKYYLAGNDDKSVYLGHYLYKLKMLQTDYMLTGIQTYQLAIDSSSNYPFTNVWLNVRPPYFYLTDGSIRLTFRGRVGQPLAKKLMVHQKSFIYSLPIADETMAISVLQNKDVGVALAAESKKQGLQIKPGLLQKQLDGIFCVDGKLHFDAENHLLVYIYNYRNEFFTLDTCMHLLHRYHTIDTNKYVKMQVAALGNKRTMASPPNNINAGSCVDNGLLYVQSPLKADNEAIRNFKQHTVIDVYALENGRYIGSLYLDTPKIRQFQVKGNILMVLADDKLISYHIEGSFVPKDLALRNKAGRQTEHL